MKVSLFVLCAILTVIQAAVYSQDESSIHEAGQLGDYKQETATYDDGNQEKETYDDDEEPEQAANYSPTIIKPKIKLDYNNYPSYKKTGSTAKKWNRTDEKRSTKPKNGIQASTIIKPKINLVYGSGYQQSGNTDKKRNRAVQRRRNARKATPAVKYNGLRRTVSRKQVAQNKDDEAEEKSKLVETVDTAKPASGTRCPCGVFNCSCRKPGEKGSDEQDSSFYGGKVTPAVKYNGLGRSVSRKQVAQNKDDEAEEKSKLLETVDTAKPASGTRCPCGVFNCSCRKPGEKGSDEQDSGFYGGKVTPAVKYNGLGRIVSRKQVAQNKDDEAEEKSKLVETVDTTKPAGRTGCACGVCNCSCRKPGEKGSDGEDGDKVGDGVSGYGGKLADSQNDYYNSRIVRGNRVNGADYSRFGGMKKYFERPESLYGPGSDPSPSWAMF